MATATLRISLYKQPRWKRGMDLLLASAILVLIWPLLLLISLAIRLTSPGPALHWSKRVGKDNSLFLMPKFRTMRIDTPQLATHLMKHPERYLTPVGRFLRKTSLDELPQLLSVLQGHLSLVGPRPALFNQDDLVALRTRAGVHRMVPGITGWAQVNGRDEMEIPDKVQYDAEYMESQSFRFDLKILTVTLLKVVRADGVRH